MSFRSVLELVLQLESFRNVDIYQQGLYKLNCRVYQDLGQSIVAAVPYSYFTDETDASTRSTKVDHHHLIPAQIYDDTQTFSSRAFLIRYCEEEVELCDHVQFRIEVDATQRNPSDGCLICPLVVEILLMFADFKSKLGDDGSTSTSDVDTAEFSMVATQIFKIQNAAKGIHSYLPIMFEDAHFSVARAVLHTCLLDFRFRLRPLITPVESAPYAPIRPVLNQTISTTQVDPPCCPNKKERSLDVGVFTYKML
eukprot:GHVL01020770.1.p2 GENE.GHVL01020770.1~~GHVL01020770.1.p2  ORF type:complete len:253 (+),score=29.07 GHVL01020770.1:56-814(+)